MDLFQLETFLAVVETGSFSGAAKVVHRTQPAAGQVLQEYAQKMLNLRREARASLEELRQFQRGTLVLAANEFTSLYLLRVLEEFRRFSPMIRIEVQRGLAS